MQYPSCSCVVHHQHIPGNKIKLRKILLRIVKWGDPTIPKTRAALDPVVVSHSPVVTPTSCEVLQRAHLVLKQLQHKGQIFSQGKSM